MARDFKDFKGKAVVLVVGFESLPGMKNYISHEKRNEKKPITMRMLFGKTKPKKDTSLS